MHLFYFTKKIEYINGTSKEISVILILLLETLETAI